MWAIENLMDLIVQVQKCISCKNVQQMQNYELWTWSETASTFKNLPISFVTYEFVFIFLELKIGVEIILILW